MRLNLGCGLDKRQAYDNIDFRKSIKPDLLADLEKTYLRMFKEESVDEILMKDFLEHLSWRVIEAFLRDCWRVLKRGGRVWIQTPNLEAILKRVVLDPDYKFGNLPGWKAISFWIYGEQNYPENLHKCGFTILTLKKLLKEVGFKVDEAKSNSGSNMIIRAHKPYRYLVTMSLNCPPICSHVNLFFITV